MSEPAGPGEAAEKGTPATDPPIADPERGLRGAISATLVLEAITVLLSIPLIAGTRPADGGRLVLIIGIVALAFALIVTCMFVRKTWLPILIFSLQAVVIAGWVFSGPLGVVGVLFTAVFVTIFYLRNEYRRRAAAGLLPGQQHHPEPGSESEPPASPR